ncbi:hypothetical protein N7456_005941 [Penicillium angulare]|uniref:Aminoglycoside phosphotransferase domain-containing protein n=1 Tax=Penicillium angulare TaxID=116970 RepID=A0A9W9FZG1_9EURO|nr:hypothetical protein N7456_005941 [Penicillium angulare]
MTPSTSNKVNVGSASWLGADGYDKDSEFAQRANRFLRDINWDRLKEICCELGDSQCQLSEKFSIGHFNMARHVLFDDGKSWIVRLRMPNLKEDHVCQDVKMALSSEVACMNFLMEQTSIPVPKVYGFETEPKDVGAPYIIMEYIPGTVARELLQQIDAPLYQFGTPEQDQNFRRQMAGFQVEMASFKFDKIGSLYQDSQSGDFYIGPDCQTGQGPWESSLEYYRCLANQKLEECLQNAPEEVLNDYSFSLPVVFERLVTMYTEKTSILGPFGLAHLDFGAHNLLVNKNFEIIAVIDFDGFISAPIEVQAQFPCFMGLDVEPPLFVETEPIVLERIDATKPKLEEYKHMIEESEREIEYGGDIMRPQQRLGDLLLSEASAIIYGLKAYGAHQDFINQMWMYSFSRLLRQKTALTIGELERPENDT